MTIQANQQVFIKQEWQDEGDSNYVWRALEDEDGGRVLVVCEMGLPINPTSVMQTEWLESAE